MLMSLKYGPTDAALHVDMKCICDCFHWTQDKSFERYTIS